MRYLSTILLVSGCASAAPSAAPVVGVDPSPAAPQLTAAQASACAPLPTDAVLAEVVLDEARALHVVGKPIRTVEAGGAYEVFDAQLLLVRGTCLLSRARIGEMSRAVEADLRAPAPELLPIGATDGNGFSIERGRVGDADVVLVIVPLDLRWGLTEYHLAPFTMSGDHLVAGDRVQSGRDAMDGNVYYGQTQERDGAIVVLRRGPGETLPPITLRLGADRALHATPKPVAR